MLPSIIILVLVVVFIFIVNSLIMKSNMVKNAAAGVDVQLKKRFDLVPNLVASVKRYLEHESETLTRITELRNSGRATPAELDRELTGALRQVMIQVENYPDLKASDNMTQLQRSLNEIEEQLAAARRAYNAAATDFNNAITMFPGVMFAGMLKFSKVELFSIPEAEKANVNVGELFKG